MTSKYLDDLYKKQGDKLTLFTEALEEIVETSSSTEVIALQDLIESIIQIKFNDKNNEQR